MANQPSDYEFIREFMLKRTGVRLDQDKNYLIDTRLNVILRNNSFKDLGALVGILKTASRIDLVAQIIDALTTHETYFFRDREHFTGIGEKILPNLIEARRKERSLRIWSAACSNGQELYSIGILLAEMNNILSGWDIRLIGTDISVDVLAKAANGLYSDYEVERGLDLGLRAKYFKRVEGVWKIVLPGSIKIEFMPINLHDDFSKLGMFDFVLLRNVLIYFDLDKKKDILNRVHRSLRDDGSLMLGTAETTTNLVDCFTRKMDGKVVYFVK